MTDQDYPPTEGSFKRLLLNNRPWHTSRECGGRAVFFPLFVRFESASTVSRGYHEREAVCTGAGHLFRRCTMDAGAEREPVAKARPHIRGAGRTTVL